MEKGIVLIGLLVVMSAFMGLANGETIYQAETEISNQPDLFTTRLYNVPTHKTPEGYDLAPIVETGYLEYSYKSSPTGYDIYWGSNDNGRPLVLMSNFYENLEVKWQFLGYKDESNNDIMPFTQPKPHVEKNKVYWYTPALELITINTANGLVDHIIVNENGTDYFNANGDSGTALFSFRFWATWPVYVNGSEITVNGTYNHRSIKFSNGTHDFDLKSPTFYHGNDGYSYPAEYEIIYNTEWDFVDIAVKVVLDNPDFLKKQDAYPITVDPTISIWYTGYFNTIIRDCDFSIHQVQVCYGDENLQFFRITYNEYLGGYSTPNFYWTDMALIKWQSLGGGDYVTDMYLTGYFRSLTQGPYAVISKVKIYDVWGGPYIEWVQNLTVAQSSITGTGIILDISFNYTGSQNGVFYFLGRSCIDSVDTACGTTYELFYDISTTANTTVNKRADSSLINPNTWHHGDYNNKNDRYILADRNGKVHELDLYLYSVTQIFNMPTQESGLRYAGFGFDDGDLDYPLNFFEGLDHEYITAKAPSGHGRVIIFDVNTDTVYSFKYLNETGFDGFWAWDVSPFACVSPHPAEQCFWVTTDEIGIAFTGKLGLWFSKPYNQSWQFNDQLPIRPLSLDVWAWSGLGGEGMIGTRTGHIMGWNVQSFGHGEIVTPLENQVYYAPNDDQNIATSFRMLSNESEVIGWNITIKDELGPVFWEVGYILPVHWTTNPLSAYYYQKINTTTTQQYPGGIYTIELRVKDAYYSSGWWVKDTREFIISNGSRALITTPANQSTFYEGDTVNFVGSINSTFEYWQKSRLPVGDNLLDNSYNWTIKNATGGIIYQDYNRTFNYVFSTDGTYKILFNGWDGVSNSNETFIDLIILDRPAITPGVPGNGRIVRDTVCDGTEIPLFGCVEADIASIGLFVSLLASSLVIIVALLKLAGKI